MASSSTPWQNQTQPENAFDGIAPYSAPKSTEAWDIFINHYGPDVYRLARTIYATLDSMGFRVFLDLEALEAGDSVPAEIQNAIASATLHIAIFSPNYAQSAWCLAELSFMLKSGAEMIPIFYQVDPSDLGYIGQGKGLYASAFSEHEKKGRYKSEKLDEWKRALCDSSFLYGYLVNNIKDWGTLLRNIVNRALKIMEKPSLWVAHYPVGLDKLDKGFKSVARAEKVKLTGIVGLGGSGKTTLATEHYNRNFSSFKRHSFVIGVGDAASRNSLVYKKEKILADHVDEGKVSLANRLWSNREIPLFDKLNALLPNKDILRSLRRFIVKYRKSGVPNRHSPEYLCYPNNTFEKLIIGKLDKLYRNNIQLDVIRGMPPSDGFVAFNEYMHQSMGESNRRLQPPRLKESHSPEGNEFTEELASLLEKFVPRWLSFLPSNIPSWVSLRKEVCNGLEELWENHVAPPVQLRLLNLTGTIQKIPRSIDHFQHLKKLEFSFDGSRLPAELCGLRWLEHLSLSSTVLSALPAGFGNLTSLRYLSLGYCRQLKMLPDSFQQLVHLEWLNLAGCKMISSLPAGLGNLTNLRCLNLRRGGQLRMLPDSFQQLIRLEEVKLPADSKERLQTSYNALSEEEVKLPADIKERLQASYNVLSEEETQMFLDTACFLIGEKKTRAIALWDGCGWSGLRGLETLENKCLVELVDDPDYHGEKIIKMQDHIRDMGREFACSRSPYRVWSPEQIVNMKKHCMERELIRGILSPGAFVAFKGYMRQSMGETSTQSQHLRFSTGLQILSVEGNEFTEELASLLEDLVWLRWEGFPRRSLPPWLPLRELSVLELHGANEMEELWEDKEHAPLQLRELIITGTWSASFERFPCSISNLNNLKKIALLGDIGKEFGIKGLPEEFCHLQSLEHLELRHCTLLSSLPARFGDLRSLQHLDLCSCKEIRILPDSFKQLTQLQCLDLSGCEKLALQQDILENIRNLKNLYLSGCLKLKQLPDQVTDQDFLRELRLQDTRLDVLPPNIGQLRKLELLTIGSPFLTSLPVSLGDLCSLKTLSIIDCIDLEYLPETLGRLTLLEHLRIESSEVRSLPEGLTGLANLQSLKISGCPLSKLDFGSGSSSRLWNLKVIEISETCVARISITDNCCPRLEKLHISRNDYLEEIEALPTTVKIIELSECENLKSGDYGGKLEEIEPLPITAKNIELGKWSN